MQFHGKNVTYTFFYNNRADKIYKILTNVKFKRSNELSSTPKMKRIDSTVKRKRLQNDVKTLVVHTMTFSNVKCQMSCKKEREVVNLSKIYSTIALQRKRATKKL